MIAATTAGVEVDCLQGTSLRSVLQMLGCDEEMREKQEVEEEEDKQEIDIVQEE